MAHGLGLSTFVQVGREERGEVMGRRFFEGCVRGRRGSCRAAWRRRFGGVGPRGSEDAGVVVSACLEHLLLSLEAGIGGDGGGREVVESVLSVAVHGPPLVDPLGLPGLFGDRRGAEVGASLLEAAFDEEIARLPEQPGGDHRPRPFTESSRVSESASSTSSPASPRAAGNSSSSSAIPRSIAFTCSFTRRNWATSNRMISTALRAVEDWV